MRPLLSLPWLLTTLVWLVPVTTWPSEDPQNGASFKYHFSNPEWETLADSVLNSSKLRLSKLLRDDLTNEINVYIAESSEEFDSLAGGSFPDWGAGVAIPIWKRIVIKSPMHFDVNRSLQELLVHEYTHLALADRTGFHRPPRWFDEGMAMVVSMQWNWSDNLAMNLAAVTGNLIKLKEIEQVNRFRQQRARMSYATSYLAVQYMFDAYGIRGVNIFLDSVAAGASLDNSLLAAAGSNYDDFEAEFHVYLQGRFNIVSLAADTMYFWLALAIILIIGAGLKYRKRREYYRKWEKEEELASTDFDYGDPDDPEQIDDDEPWRS